MEVGKSCSVFKGRSGIFGVFGSLRSLWNSLCQNSDSRIRATCNAIVETRRELQDGNTRSQLAVDEVTPGAGVVAMTLPAILGTDQTLAICIAGLTEALIAQERKPSPCSSDRLHSIWPSRQASLACLSSAPEGPRRLSRPLRFRPLRWSTRPSGSRPDR